MARYLLKWAVPEKGAMKMLDVPQSGSIGGTTSSRNRYGQYKRERSIPVNPATSQQGVIRARFGNNSAAWRALTDAQRAGWEALGASIVRTDPLGQSYDLNGQGAHMMVNNNLLDAGEAAVTAAPAIVTPGTLLTATITLTAASFSIAYTATPLAASTRLFVYASPQRSAGRSFEGDFRLIHVSAAAAASPADIFSAYQTRLGTPVVGQRIFLSLVLHKGGFRGAPLLTSAVVSA